MRQTTGGVGKKMIAMLFCVQCAPGKQMREQPVCVGITYKCCIFQCDFYSHVD